MEQERRTNVKAHTKGRVTIPTDIDVVPETLELLERWGADAIRDCDGTDYPEELRSVDAKVYSTYYTTRKDNEWAKANPDEIQQMYIMTPFYTAVDSELSIHLMISPDGGKSLTVQLEKWFRYRSGITMERLETSRSMRR